MKFRAFFKDSLGHEGVRDFDMATTDEEDARVTAQGLMPIGARLERVEPLPAKAVSDDG